MKTQIPVLVLGTALLTPALATAQAPTDSATAQPSNGAASAGAVTTPPPTAAAPADRSTAVPVPPTAEPTGRRGLLLRMQLGGGYRSTSSGVGSTSLQLTGAGLGFSILAGGAVAENLFVYGEFLDEMAANPTIQAGQKQVVANHASLNLYGFGPGVTYLLPRGVHLGGTLLLTRMKIEKDEQVLGSTDLGFGLTARVGKDFWLGPRNAIGIVGQFTLASMNDQSDSSAEPPSFLATAFTLALSGTYN